MDRVTDWQRSPLDCMRLASMALRSDSESAIRRSCAGFPLVELLVELVVEEEPSPAGWVSDGVLPLEKITIRITIATIERITAIHPPTRSLGGAAAPAAT